ncbi:serum amyloid A-2 protein-like [Sorex araneus]|uniref:serum amyloid A-2 protein-like n=1 Tax=Sorex araneus TaxID=42254 RepID=UPI002433C4AD|nr:serum amyloid A-2 protein-like [Sorex araneus]
MKLFMAIIFCSLFLCVSSNTLFSNAGQAVRDMQRAYRERQKNNYRNLGKSTIPRWNYNDGPRGVIQKDLSENQRLFEAWTSGHGLQDSLDNQFANEWGRSGKDPNDFRPEGLPSKY